MKTIYHFLFALLLATSLAWTNDATAQRPHSQVTQLNRQAMDKYTNLELDEARRILERALRIARRSGVNGTPLARTYLNLAVVSIGGFQENAEALEYFVSALEEDPDIQLDPLTSTPEVQQVFTLAKTRMDNQTSSSTSEVQHSSSNSTGMAAGNIPHQPAREQLAQTAIPVFIAAPANADVTTVYVYYKGLGMPEFRRGEMERMDGGFGFEIPCADVFEPSVDYYIAAFAADGTPLGNAGSQENPNSVPIVSHRSTSPPALPGRAPPATCRESECPPGMPGCAQSCASDSQCGEGHKCEDELCVADNDDDDDASEGPRFFFNLGTSIGLGYASSGMQADSVPPALRGSAPDAIVDAAWVPNGEGDCQLDSEPTGDPNTETAWCARIATPGFVPAIAIRAVLGYYITPRFAIAAHARFQPNAGQGNLANWLFGARLQYQFTQPKSRGFVGAAFIGSSLGQIQLQPPQDTGGEEPYIISGLNSAQLGGVLGVRITRNFGIFYQPELHIMFPTLLIALDNSLMLEVGF
jgi:hypothetical protein